MGKKLGENSKAVAARERKAAAKEEQTTLKKKQTEDEYWRDDDKHAAKKQQKKEEQDRKRQEQLKKKAETNDLLEQELSTIKKSAAKVPPPPKVTRTQIAETLKTAKEKEKGNDQPSLTHLDVPLEENLNRLVIEGEARSVTEAISILDSKEKKVDRHPEKRMKAAYNSYEERRLKELKQESPTLKHSQLKQLIFKEWQKAPENPLNMANPDN